MQTTRIRPVLEQEHGAPRQTVNMPEPMRLSVTELARGCAQETARFRKKQPSDSRFGLELFRRAIELRDDEAWAHIYTQYGPLVLSWIMQHPGAALLLQQEDSSSLVNAAFAKFACALSPAKMQDFDQLPALLQYLKRCTHSVVADTMRYYQARRCEEPLETIEQEPAHDDPAFEVISGLAAQGVWQIIAEALNGEDERVLMNLAYIHGLTPVEISRQQHRHFPTVEDVYRVKRNILERLRRNRRLLALCQSPF